MKNKIFILTCLLSMVAFYSCQNTITPPPPTYDGPQPFVIDYRSAANTAIDLSFLLEKPAGNSGFITSKGGKFVKPDGTNFRFWGFNQTGWTPGSVSVPEKEESVFWAKALARLGINIIRIHWADQFMPRGLLDPNRLDAREFDPVQLDKFDFWVSELKKNGIYTNINLMTYPTFRAGDGLIEYDQIGNGKYASYFAPQLIKLQKDFAAKLLTHYNPYTQLEYRNDPAVAMIEIFNENSLIHAWHIDGLHPHENPTGQSARNFRPLSNYYSDMLTTLFNDYLAKNYDSETVARIRSQSGADANGLIPRPRQHQYESAGKEWFQATVAFYTDVEKQHFLDMKSFLKDSLGSKSMLVGSDDFLGHESRYPQVESNAVLDMIDGHVYWQHPSWPGKLHSPMVNEPDSSTIARLSRTALTGLPYIVSEVNHTFPHDFECEGIPILAAYGSFQDWDGFMLYTWEPKVTPDYVGYVGDNWDVSHHPVKIPQMIASALMYLRGDVRAGNQTVERTYTREQIAETMRMPVTEMPYYTPGYAVSYAFKHKVRIGSMNGPETQPFAPVTDNPLVSDTKELTWDTTNPEKGFVTVNAPSSQALIGFVKANNPHTDNLSVLVNNEFCTFTLSSLEDQPIGKASRLLLTAGGKVVNTPVAQPDAADRQARFGGPPSTIEVISGLVVLQNLEGTKSVEIRPLDGAGVPFGEPVKADKSGKKWTFPIGKDVTTWYIINVTR